MQIPRILIALFLTWSAYDIDLFRRRRSFARADEISFAEEATELKQAKHAKKYVRPVAPPWFKKAKVRVRSKVNHTRTQTLDPRYSDQRKIRRRFNNA